MRMDAGSFFLYNNNGIELMAKNQKGKKGGFEKSKKSSSASYGYENRALLPGGGLALSQSVQSVQFSSVMSCQHPARYTLIQGDFLRHRGHLVILAAHTSQHTRWPHSL